MSAFDLSKNLAEPMKARGRVREKNGLIFYRKMRLNVAGESLIDMKPNDVFFVVVVLSTPIQVLLYLSISLMGHQYGIVVSSTNHTEAILPSVVWIKNS